MKLPTDPPSSQPKPSGPSSTSAAELGLGKSGQSSTLAAGTRTTSSAMDSAHASGSASSSQATPSPVLDDAQKQSQLNQLRHQWAKVVSSQPLSEHQLERLVQNQQLKGEAATIKWQLVKLETLNGLLSILSSQGATKGSTVMIQQSPNGQWQLNTSQHTWFQSLMHNALMPIASNAPAPTSLNQALGAAFNALMTTTSSPNSPLVNTLDTNKPVNSPAVQSGLEASGQRFEAKLAMALKQAISQALTHPEQTKPNEGYSQSSAEKPVASGFNAALAQLANSLPKGSHGPTITQESITGVKSAAETLLKQAEQSLNQWIGKVRQQWQGTEPNQSQARPQLPMQTSDALRTTIGEAFLTISQSDLKGSLLGQQHSMVSQLLKQDWVQALLPNVVATLAHTTLATPSHPATTSNGNPNQDFLSLLFKPKPFTPDGGDKSNLPVWPKNLAVQPIIERVLSQLIAQAPKEADTQQAQQALRLAQQINRIQGEQIHNRLSQDTPAQQTSPALQLSLPYLHQNEPHWAKLEWTSEGATNKDETHVKSWHMILRFLQEQPRAFAIECHLTHHTLNIVMWSKNTPQLRQLNEYKSQLMEGLTQAGFKVENIMTKNGNPPSLAQPIQNNLVDVRT